MTVGDAAYWRREFMDLAETLEARHQSQLTDLQWFVEELYRLDALRFGPDDTAGSMLGAYGVRLVSMIARAKEVVRRNGWERDADDAGGVANASQVFGGSDTEETFIATGVWPCRCHAHGVGHAEATEFGPLGLPPSYPTLCASCAGNGCYADRPLPRPDAVMVIRERPDPVRKEGGRKPWNP